jgi:long-subunit fatty acid transport protein
MGIGINPASASGEKGLFSIDVGFIFFSLDIFLDGPEQDLLVERYGELPEGWNPIRGSVTSQGISPSPNLALRIPLKDWGIGWNFFVPYGSGASFDEKGVQRFSTNGGHLLFFENALSLARTWKRETDSLKVGVGVRHIYGTTSSSSASDTGTIIYGLTGDPSLILDPVMEGKRATKGEGQSFGFSAGMHWIHPKISIHAAYRSSIPIDLIGSFENQLSSSLTVAFEGSATLKFHLPQELYLGTTIPIANKYKVRLDGGWVDWKQFRQLNVSLQDMAVVSESPFFQEILEAYNLTSNELVTADQNISIDNGMRSAYFARIGVDIQVRKELQIRTRMGYSTASVPIGYTTPSNGDYPSLQLDVGGMWSPNSRLTFALNALYLHKPEKIVEVGESVYSPYNDSSTQSVGFSGAGRYKMRMARLGLMTQVQF